MVPGRDDGGPSGAAGDTFPVTVPTLTPGRQARGARCAWPSSAGVLAGSSPPPCESADPTREVTVFERNRAEDTFGFGVVFSDATLAGIHDADPVLRKALSEHGVHWDAIEVRLQGEVLRCGGNGMAAVVRRTLLQVMQARAREVGVDLRFSTPVDPERLLVEGYDLVVAADGAGSHLREQFTDVFEPTVETATAKFIWFGTTYLFDGLTFVHERSEHGVFAVHGYPIGDGLATFIVETDEASWRAAGLDEFDVTQPPGASDVKSRGYLEELFADQIDGATLLTNNSRWGNFRTRRAAPWPTASATPGRAPRRRRPHRPLLGRLGHEDGDGGRGRPGRRARRAPGRPRRGAGGLRSGPPAPVAKIQDSARPSLAWWEHFGRYHDALRAWQFAYHFFSRSITDAKLRRRDDDFVSTAADHWAEEHHAPPLDSPVHVAGRTLTGRRATVTDTDVRLDGSAFPLRESPPQDGTPWALPVTAPGAEGELADARGAVAKGVAAGAALVVVEGGTSLTRRLLTEAARLEDGAVTVLVEDPPADRADDIALTAVLSGRTDLVGTRS